MLGSFLSLQLPCKRFDDCFGPGKDASPWKFGAVPRWIWMVFLTHLADFKGIRRDNNNISLNQPPVVGYSVLNSMRTMLRAIWYLHMLRGFPMSPAVHAALRHYVVKVLHKKYPTIVKKAAPVLQEHAVRAVHHPAIATGSLFPSGDVNAPWVQRVSLSLLLMRIIILACPTIGRRAKHYVDFRSCHVEYGVVRRTVARVSQWSLHATLNHPSSKSTDNPFSQSALQGAWYDEDAAFNDRAVAGRTIHDLVFNLVVWEWRLGRFIHADLGQIILGGCFHKSRCSKTLPLLPELVDGLQPSPQAVSMIGMRLRLSLGMRVIGLDRTFHGGRSGYVNSRLLQEAAEHGQASEGVLRQIEWHLGFTPHSLTLHHYMRSILINVANAFQRVTHQPAGSDSCRVAAVTGAGIACDASAAAPDAPEYMSTAMQSIWDGAAPGSDIHHRVNVVLQVQQMIYPVLEMPTVNTLPEAAAALYTGGSSTFQLCRPIIFACTHDTMCGGVFWEANPAYLAACELQLQQRLAEHDIPWGRRFSEAFVSRPHADGKDVSDEQCHQWLTEAKATATLRRNMLVAALQRAVRGQPLPVQQFPPHPAARHGEAGALTALMGGMNRSKKCAAKGLLRASMASTPAHMLDDSGAGMPVLRFHRPADFDGMDAAQSLDTFGSFLPSHVRTAIDQLPLSAQRS